MSRGKKNSAWHRARLLRIASAHTNGHCHLCGKVPISKNITIDHFIPLSYQGHRRNGINLRIACNECNSDRGVMPVDLFKMSLHLIAQHPMLQARVQEPIAKFCGKVWAGSFYKRLKERKFNARNISHQTNSG